MLPSSHQSLEHRLEIFYDIYHRMLRGRAPADSVWMAFHENFVTRFGIECELRFADLGHQGGPRLAQPDAPARSEAEAVQPLQVGMPRRMDERHRRRFAQPQARGEARVRTPTAFGCASLADARDPSASTPRHMPRGGPDGRRCGTQR